jgi:long-chain acyl-CoA synthetase
MPIDQILRKSAAIFPGKTALFFEKEAISFQALDQEVDNLAQGLIDTGFNFQDKAGMILGNNPDFVRSYFAITRSGGTVVPLNPSLKAEEVKFILSDAGISHLIAAAQYYPLIQRIRQELPRLKRVIVVGDPVGTEPLKEGDLSYAALLGRQAGPVNSGANDQDIAACLYTSGTTGRPKGALLSHQNLLFDAEQAALRVGITAEDQNLCVLPLFHSFAQMAGMLIPILRGSGTTIMPQFMPGKILKEISARKINFICAVPVMYLALLPALAENNNCDLSSLRVCVSGGSALPLEVHKAYQENYGLTLVEGNGPTETSPIAYVNPPAACKAGSVGPPLAGVAVKILGENGTELPQGEVGEICIQGPNVMQGYLNQPEATAETLKNGWLHTGDLGRVDADGYVYIVDRKKDLIIVGGQNVYPREVEECLFHHPQVAEAAVIGILDKNRAEVPKAYIVLKPGVEAEPKEFILYCRKHLANYKCPREIAFVRSLPKNSTGKIDKKQLKEAEILGLTP